VPGTEHSVFSSSSRPKTKLQALGEYAGEATIGSTTHGQIEQYLLTGETDPLYTAWPGGFLERATRGRQDLRAALASAVKGLSTGRADGLPDTDCAMLARGKVEPMVIGLFPRREQNSVLTMLEDSVTFVTSVNIERLLFDCAFDGSAWTLANLYLASLDLELLGPSAPRLAGFSEERTCYVSTEYFRSTDPFADFIVHETAHIFHNCKRSAAGLPETRARVWLLDIEYRMREVFAYSCEAYARVMERGKSRAEHQKLAEEYGRVASIADERVDSSEVASIVQAAAATRNGWKTILAKCAPNTPEKHAPG